MNEQQALARMTAPGTKRPGKFRQGVIQIWTTRACDKSCFGCTQGSNLAGKPGMITPAQFEEAVKSLVGYFGVVGIFGGNPATHPQFETLCLILAKYIPKEKRGLWCNNPLGKGRIMREVFNPSVSNLNVHLDQKAYDEFKRDWPECHPVGLKQDSRHSPPYVAIKDVIADESLRWSMISDCDINKHWSAMIGIFRGQLRAWFCEIAGAQSMLHQGNPDYPDTGMPVNPDTTGPIVYQGKTYESWWQLPMTAFAHQVRKHCHDCGVPLRGYGELAQAPDDQGKEQTSKTHEDIYIPKRKGRRVELAVVRSDLGPPLRSMVDYLGNSQR